MTATAETEAEIRRLFHAERWKVGTIASPTLSSENIGPAPHPPQ
jgi:hypothetical protein